MSYLGDGLDLLPPNASPQEVETALTVSRVSDIEETLNNSPVMPAVAPGQSTPSGASTAGDAIRNLWNVENCPSYLLPWMAWTFGVNSWSSAWTDAQKRAIISSAISVHQVKGTVGAVQRVINSFGAGFSIVEWFENGGAPYTFALYVSLSTIPSAVWNSIIDAVNEVKPVRSTMVVNFSVGYTAGVNVCGFLSPISYQRFSANLN